MRKEKRKRIAALCAAALLMLSGCASTKEKTQEAAYMNITAQEAKKLMDTETDYVILDVRNEEEYAQGHILGAIVIPYTELEDRAEEELPDKDQLILVYCRSGRRSRIGAETLRDLGYTRIREFGGILDWPYETE